MNKSDIRKVISESILADGMSPVIDLKKSHGSWLVDKVTGKEYLDLFSMFASLSVGYNHPYVLEQSERLKVAAINKPTNSDVYSQEMAEFVHTFKIKLSIYLFFSLLIFDVFETPSYNKTNTAIPAVYMTTVSPKVSYPL